MKCENCRFFHREGICGKPDSDYVAREVQPEDGCLHGVLINQPDAGMSRGWIINQRDRDDKCNMPGM